MGNKKKKNHKTIYLSPELLEKQTRQDLAEKKFRAAIEGFKNLCKQTQADKKKYANEFIECYQGLADVLIQKGQISEAKIVLDNLKPLTGKNTAYEAEAIFAFKTKNFPKAAKSYISLLSQDNDIPAGKKAWAMAGALVLSFEEFPELKASHIEIYDDLRAIQFALQEICEEKFDSALIRVREIKRNSIFSNWKMFIKGLAAFYSFQDEKAIRAFSCLPAEDLLHSIAMPYLLLLGDSIDKEVKPTEDFLKIVIEAAGYPELSPLLPRAEYLWNVGRYRDSYKHIRAGLNSFPSEKKTMEHNLSLFYFNSSFHLPGSSAVKYLDEIELINRTAPDSPEKEMEAILLNRVICLCVENSFDDNKRVAVWNLFLKSYQKVYPNSSKLHAYVYSHLGSYYAQMMQREFDSFPWGRLPNSKPGMRNPDLAEYFFTESLKIDKHNKDTYLGLLRVYEKNNSRQKANKLLDKLIMIFPDEKKIISKAGNECVKRKAYVKAITYFEKASALDTLDSITKDELAFAYIKTALSYYEKGKVKQGREIFEKAVRNSINSLENFNRGISYIYARWSAVEFNAKENVLGEEKLNLAFSTTSNATVIKYFSLLIFMSYGVSGSYIQYLKDEIDRNDKIVSSSPCIVVSLIKIFLYMQHISGNKNLLAKEKVRLSQYAKNAVISTCSREEAHAIILFAVDQAKDLVLAHSYLEKMLSQDKDDPLFLYLKLKLKKRNYSSASMDKEIKELHNILEIAKKRDEKELIRVVSEKIREAEVENESTPCDCPECRANRSIDEEEPILKDFINEFLKFTGQGKKRKKR